MEQHKIAHQEFDPATIKKKLPNQPGVYLFKDSSGRVIYVGKAKDLKKRLLSYFRPPEALPYKTGFMMGKARDLDFLITENEKEAFILERNLIKKHMPRYNIVLRDDKQYPCLRLDPKDPYPRLQIVRRMKKDGALYFGPYSSALSVRQTLKLINRIFQLRKCKQAELPKRSRPCLNYQLQRCLGPCTENVPVERYKGITNQVRLFLEGRNQELVEKLNQDMKSASEQLNFEEAARIRDQIRAVERTLEQQYVVSSRMENQDVIGLVQKDGLSQIVILFIRQGKLINTKEFLFKDKGEPSSELMESFIKQFYTNDKFIPNEIISSHAFEDLQSVALWLSEEAGRKIVILNPKRGERLRLVQMAVNNAQESLSRQTSVDQEALAEEMKLLLDLKNTPLSIEGMDISNFQGDMAVGTIVPFIEGHPHRSGYRNYRIRSINGVDDYGMMAELAERRLKRKNLPDLFLIDGGRGHLLAVKKVMDQFLQSNLDDKPDLIALAKADERKGENADKIILVERKNPILLRPDNPILHLLMRIRDEAHRRAITYHRKLRGRKLKSSDLDKIPGIGPKRKKFLLKHFKGIEKLADVSIDEIREIPGINLSLAESIYTFFNQSND